MARTKKTYKKHRKGSYWATTKQKGGYNSNANHFASPNRTLAPNTKLVNLRFALAGGDVHQMESTTGDIINWKYAATDMFDPYVGGGGYQPRGFDQWMQFYRKYTVIGSKINVRFFFNENMLSTNKSMKVGVCLRDNSGTISSVADIAESPRANIKLLIGGNRPVHVSKGYSCKKFFGKQDPIDEDSLAGTQTSSPASNAFFTIVGFGLNSESSTCYFDGYIDYLAILHSPIVPSQS